MSTTSTPTETGDWVWLVSKELIALARLRSTDRGVTDALGRRSCSTVYLTYRPRPEYCTTVGYQLAQLSLPGDIHLSIGM